MPTPQTQHHALPLLAPAQAQKHVTVNEGLVEIDRRIQIVLRSVTQTDPPVTPMIGDRFGVPDNATGEWATAPGSIAEWEDGRWILTEALNGWTAFVADTSNMMVFADGGWTPVSQAEETSEIFGVNTGADSFNRFAVRSASVYLGADESGDLDLTLNRMDTAHNARIYFKATDLVQAEFGYTAGDTLRFKTTPDGTNFSTSLSLDLQGRIGLAGDADSVYSVRIDADSALADGLVIDNANSGVNASANIVLSAANGHYFKFQLYGSGSLYAICNAAMIMGTYSPSPIYFKTDTVDRMIIGTDGRIGIGSIARTATLNVDGGLRLNTVAGTALPSAASELAGTLRAVSDANGFRLAVSDGTVWREVTLGGAL